MKKTPTEITEDQIAKRLRVGTPWRSIKTELHCGFDRISRVSNFMNCNAGQSPKPQPLGRKPIITPVVLTFIEEETLKDPLLGSCKLGTKILDNFGITASHTTISLIRNLLKFRFRKPRTTQNLNDGQIQKRIEFCTNNLTNEIDWSSNVLISDESRFSIGDDSRRRWIRRGMYLENTFQKKAKFQKSLMVWACIGKNFKSPLIFIEGNLNTDGYIDMLTKNKVFETASECFSPEKVYFQQDGATCHTSKRSTEYIKQHIELIENWPSNSPDLSPIENLWGILKYRLHQKTFTTIAELKLLLNQEWESIEMSLVNSLIEQIPARMELCLQQSGKQIGHLLHKIDSRKIKADDEITMVENPLQEETEAILSIFITTSYETFYENTSLKTICYLKKGAAVFQMIDQKFDYCGECVVAIVETRNKNCILIRRLEKEATIIQSNIDAETNAKCQGSVAISLILETCERRKTIYLIRFHNPKTRDKFYQKVIEFTRMTPIIDSHLN
jgi:hypothetical protein